MTGMIDRVARLLQGRDSYDSVSSTNSAPDEPLDPSYIEDARLVIAAMRISTLSMSEAGDKLIDKAYKNGAYEDSEYVWTAMIDDALGVK